MNNNIGILIFGDPTRGGTIKSETKFLANIYEKNKDSKFFILTVNPSVTKRVIRQASVSYPFPFELMTIFNEEDYHKLDQLSGIVTYPGHSNFFGGYLNDNIITMYKIISKCTNTLKIPVFIRINDSEIKVRDYRKMSDVRLIDGITKPESAFMKDPKNVAKATDLVSWKEWDYEKVFWFGNGSKEVCDWVSETLFDRENEDYRMASKETFENNTIYVSDDIFFIVTKNYERFQTEFSTKLQIPTKINKFSYIGFFDTVNAGRIKALHTLFKKNLEKIPLKIFGKGTEKLTKLKDFENFDIEEGYIEGDSDEYFKFLHDHLGYIFIGKGQSKSRYIGKTAYDAVVARTPIIVYRPCDQDQIMFYNDEYYFSDERELKQIFQKLQDPVVRTRWINDQASQIFDRLPKKDFQFSEYCNLRQEIDPDFFFDKSTVSIPVPPKPKSTPTSISLF